MNPASVDLRDLIEKIMVPSLGEDGQPLFDDMNHPIVERKFYSEKGELQNLFIGKEPKEPVNCTTLYDTGGGEQDAKFAYDESMVQVRTRHKDYLSGYNVLNDIRKALEGINDFQTLDETRYVGIWVSSNIAFMKRDENDRAIWTVNFRILRQPALGEGGHRQLNERG